jgi:phage gpG-like protein
MPDVFEMSFSFRNKTFSDASIGLQAYAAELRQDWNAAEQVLSKELKDFLTSVAQALASRHGGSWPGGTGAMTLSRRSGALIDSIAASVTVSGDTMDSLMGSIGSNVPYAAIQEFGGTIHAKNAKFLCIPLPAALDGSGLPIMSSPRDWPNTFVATSKAGNLIIFQKRGTSIMPLYVLKSSVVIPPRLGLKSTLDAGVGYFVARAADAIVKSMQGAG